MLIFEPARRSLPASQAAEFVPVNSARVVVMDSQFLKAHFPSVSDLSLDEQQAWFLDQSAQVRITHIDAQRVNSEFPTNRLFKRTAYIPPEYGRASMTPVRNPKDPLSTVGFFDIKGSGAERPRPGAYSNGLMTLGEALREYLMEHLIRRVLIHAGSEVTTTGSYGVIDLGFDLIHEDGSRSRAGLYVRPAVADRAFDHLNTRREVVETLKRYSILAEAPQGSSSRQLLDFGAYTIRRPESLGADPELAVPFQRWGIDESRVAPKGRELFFWAKYEAPWYAMHDLAERYARGEIQADDVNQSLKTWIQEIDLKYFGQKWDDWTPLERLQILSLQKFGGACPKAIRAYLP